VYYDALMNDQTISEALSALGLNPNATALYLQSYQTGRATVGHLAGLCGMDRSSAHLAATQLRHAGLLEEQAEGSRTLVWAKPPRQILNRLRINIRKLRSQYDAIEDNLPSLNAVYTPGESMPVMQVFSGQDGLRQIVANILEEAEGQILLMSNQAAERQVFTHQDHQDFVAERLRRQLHIRVLAADTPEGHELRAGDAAHLRQTRLIPSEAKPPFQNETYIYGQSVAMLSFRDQIFGFIVRSADFADSQRWLFERLWDDIAHNKQGGR
jgi:sugar-specific transcriptional regulator TrmB